MPLSAAKFFNKRRAVGMNQLPGCQAVSSTESQFARRVAARPTPRPPPAIERQHSLNLPSPTRLARVPSCPPRTRRSFCLTSRQPSRSDLRCQWHQLLAHFGHLPPCANRLALTDPAMPLQHAAALALKGQALLTTFDAHVLELTGCSVPGGQVPLSDESRTCRHVTQHAAQGFGLMLCLHQAAFNVAVGVLKRNFDVMWRDELFWWLAFAVAAELPLSLPIAATHAQAVAFDESKVSPAAAKACLWSIGGFSAWPLGAVVTGVQLPDGATATG